MKCTLFLLAALVLALCALSAGCTSPTQAEINPVETSLPQTTASSTATISAVVATPVQVETLPAEQYVDLQVSKERPDFTIHLLYNGGKGEAFVQNILLKVTLANGEVIEKYLNDNERRPRRGDELIVQGTRGSGSDRAEVFVTSAGRTYKALDQPLLTLTY